MGPRERSKGGKVEEHKRHTEKTSSVVTNDKRSACYQQKSDVASRVGTTPPKTTPPTFRGTGPPREAGGDEGEHTRRSVKGLAD